MVTGFSKTDRKRQKSEVAGFIGIKPRNWSSMTFAILHRRHESRSLSGFTTSSSDPLWPSSLLLTSHRATEKLFPLNYTVLDDNDNASILFSLLDLQRASNWILFEPHKGRAGCIILILRKPRFQKAKNLTQSIRWVNSQPTLLHAASLITAETFFCHTLCTANAR